jgi:hypothetical protein
MTYAEKAKEIGCAKSALSRWKDLGCNVDGTIDEIKEWRSSYLDVRGSKGKTKPDSIDEIDDNEVDLDIDFTLPEGSEPVDVLKRMGEAEKRLAGMIEAMQDLPKTSKLNARLALLRREYRETSRLFLAASKIVKEMEHQAKNYIPRAEFEEKLLQSITVLSMFIMNLSGRIITNPEEKPMLVAIAQSWDLEIAARLLYDFKLNVNAPQWEQDFEKYVADKFRIDYEKLLKYRTAKGFKTSSIQPDDNAVPKDQLAAFQESLNDPQ